MHRGVAWKALKFHCHIRNPLDKVVIVVHLLKRWHYEFCVIGVTRFSKVVFKHWRVS